MPPSPFEPQLLPMDNPISVVAKLCGRSTSRDLRPNWHVDGLSSCPSVFPTEPPPALAYDELAVLGLIEIEGASEPGKPQWLAMLTPAGQLRAHRIAKQRLVLLAELEDGDDNEGHPS